VGKWGSGEVGKWGSREVGKWGRKWDILREILCEILRETVFEQPQAWPRCRANPVSQVCQAATLTESLWVEDRGWAHSDCLAALKQISGPHTSRPDTLFPAVYPRPHGGRAGAAGGGGDLQ